MKALPLLLIGGGAIYFLSQSGKKKKSKSPVAEPFPTPKKGEVLAVKGKEDLEASIKKTKKPHIGYMFCKGNKINPNDLFISDNYVHFHYTMENIIKTLNEVADLGIFNPAADFIDVEKKKKLINCFSKKSSDEIIEFCKQKPEAILTGVMVPLKNGKIVDYSILVEPNKLKENFEEIKDLISETELKQDIIDGYHGEFAKDTSNYKNITKEQKEFLLQELDAILEECDTILNS